MSIGRTRNKPEPRRQRREEERREDERLGALSRNAAPHVSPAARIQTLAGDPSFMTSLARGLTVIEAFSGNRHRPTTAVLSAQKVFLALRYTAAFIRCEGLASSIATTNATFISGPVCSPWGIPTFTPRPWRAPLNRSWNGSAGSCTSPAPSPRWRAIASFMWRDRR